MEFVPSERNGPRLLSFPGGIPVNLGDLRFNVDEEDGVVAEDDALSFWQADDPSVDGLFNYAIGVFDKSTGKMKMIEINQGIAVIQQKVKLLELEDEKEMKKQIENSLRGKAPDRDEYFALTSALTKEFGNKRSKRKIREVELNRVDLQDEASKTVIGSTMKKAKAEAKRNKIEEESNQESTSEAPEVTYAKQFVPEFDLNATNPVEVYNLESIVSYEEQQTIATGKISKVLYEPDDENSKKIFQRLPEFCKCMLKKLRSSQLDKKLVKAKLKLISLLSSMILLNGSSKIVDDAAKLQKNTQCSESVAQGFLSRFFEVADMETSVSYTRSTAMQNKLKCHICVLALFLTDFEVDKEAFEALAGDFRVPAQLLGSYFMQTGCKVKQLKAGSNDTIVRLKAPVSFPKVKARQGGGAKRRY